MALWTMVEAGVVTNARKTLHPGKIVGAFALGTRKLYDFLDNNPDVEMYRGRNTNEPYVIAKNNKNDQCQQPRSRSIYWARSARSPSGPGSSVGPVVSWIPTAAHRCQMAGGDHCPALDSQEWQYFNDRPDPGARRWRHLSPARMWIRSLPSSVWAELRGRSVRDRMEALIKVAHPNFREWIRDEAHRLGMFPGVSFRELKLSEGNFRKMGSDQ